MCSALAGLAGTTPAAAPPRGRRHRFGDVLGLGQFTLLLAVTTRAQRGRATGLFQGGFLMGGIAGPPLGGLVTGSSLRAPFFFYAVTLAVAGAVGLALLPRHERAPATGPAAAPVSPPMRVRQALRLPAFRAAAFANLADNWASLGVRSAIVPLFVIEVSARAAALDGGRLHRLHRRQRRDLAARRWAPTVVAGVSMLYRRTAVAARSAVGLLAATTRASPALFLVGMMIFGLGSGSLDVAPGRQGRRRRRTGRHRDRRRTSGRATSAACPVRCWPGRWPTRSGTTPRSAPPPWSSSGRRAVAAQAPETLVRHRTGRAATPDSDRSRSG